MNTMWPATPANKGLHPTVRGASLGSAPRPAGEAQAVGPVRKVTVIPKTDPRGSRERA
jgi:hypothetical protein